MKSIAFVFPGQGSQRSGMGSDLVGNFETASKCFRSADDILGIPLSRICLNADADVLRDTSITQPAVFVTSIATMAVLREHGVEPSITAGHSLGEFAALVCAGTICWTDALLLVRLRGELMSRVGRREPGAMAAVVGLGIADVEALCGQIQAATSQVVEVANDNAPGQIVVSGHIAAVEKVCESALEYGAAKTIPLNVGAPFHCSLMADVEEEFSAALDSVDMHTPTTQFVSSVTAQSVSDIVDVRRILTNQLTARVRWTETMRTLERLGASCALEVGPGRVLKGLSKKATPELRVAATSTLGELNDVLANERTDAVVA
ncbi:ACP S-malonyltransferase [Rhodococcus sp. I2R]|uniref:ACP S-malonyltransferase n=1 Tax=Rhodococcus sp. I2R TaxID=2855445 RepID=UPI001E549660|nr:ACP S-malonyltransferase [Rhodococcus sp. I2R]MCC8926562.1 ACP S-malonyltransferase [Rhodococcus sp. I2R]